MNGLPVLLHVAGKQAVIVGGGPTAARRAAALADAGADVTVIAPEIDPSIRDTGATLRERAYRKGDLDGAVFVVVATDDAKVNDRVAEHATAAGAIVNRADDPAAGDATVMAHRTTGPVTVAVSTDGISAAAAARIAESLVGRLDRDWVNLLTTVGPFRRVAQQHVADAKLRRSVLMRMTDERAMKKLKEEGDEALAEHCRTLIAEAGVNRDA